MFRRGNLGSSSPAMASGTSSLQRIRQQLKEWEHSFHLSHGRSPTKEDVKSASPSIHALYRKYSCLKMESQAKGAKNGTQNLCSGKKRDFEGLFDNRIDVPSSLRNSRDVPEVCSDESEGSYVSATPPRKKPHTCETEDASSRRSRGQISGRNSSIDVLNDSRHVFSDISCRPGHHESQVSIEGKIEVSNVSLPKSAAKLAERVVPPNGLCGEEMSKLGFTIKMQRHGLFDKENIETDNISAGFFLNRNAALRSTGKTFSRRILAREPDARDGESQLFDVKTNIGAMGSDDTSHTNNSEQTNIAASELHISSNDASLSSESLRNAEFSDKPINNGEQSICQEMDQSVRRANSISDVSKGIFQSAHVGETTGQVSSNPAVETDCQAALKVNLEEMTVVSLRKLLSSKSLPTSGTKAALIERLMENPTFFRCEAENPNAKRNPRENHKQIKKSEKIFSKDNEKSKIDSTQPGEMVQEDSRNAGFQKPIKCATKNSDSTVEFINWSVVQKGSLKKKSGLRENFVKLNFGKGSNKRYRYGGAALKRAKRYKFRSFKKRKPKQNFTNMEETLEQYDENSVVHDLDDNSSEATYLKLTLNNESSTLYAETAEPVHIHDLDVTDVIQNPTEDSLLNVLRSVFHFKSFRPGQLKTIQQILKGDSTMLVLPTGGGKSLSYQLPAYLLPGLTLIVSPLISVMIDQLRHLPPVLPGAFLSSSQTPKEYSLVLDKLCSGRLKVLFVSPERLMCDKFLYLLQSLPCISLAVVDEAHCLSEWSHNFRPSYYRLGVILKEKLRLNRLLAMTATASKKTVNSIMESLSIPARNLVQISPVRENLLCTACRSINRCKDLLLRFQSSPFKDAKSVIVYCNFQREAENVSLVLRDNGIDAMSYHGGMTPVERKRTQDHFCNNKLRVVVATVAFGLGLDKSDVDAVIHYGLPNSVEHYMQETGRAGRNGSQAHCHLLFDDRNYLKLRSLTFSDNVDISAIRSFLSKVFLEDSSMNQIKSLPIEATTKDLDLKLEVMMTTLSYLEVGNKQYVSVLPEFKIVCTLQFHKTPPSVMARNNILIDTILNKSCEKHGEYSFELPSVANHIGIKLQDLQQKLQELQATGEISFTLKHPALCFYIREIPINLDVLASAIAERFDKMEFLKVKKLDFMFQTAMDLTIRQVSDSQPYLQEVVQRYFDSDEEYMLCKTPDIVKHRSSFLKADIKVFLQNNSEKSFSSRSIARIFHGISSPSYPSSLWSQNHFWGRYVDIDFNSIKESVASVLKERSN